MATDDILTLAAAVLAFLASVIATAVAVYNGRLAHFVGQRWWERKADAYRRTIQALAEMVYYHYHEEQLQAIEGGHRSRCHQAGHRGTLAPKSLRTQEGECDWRGEFVISSDAEEALRQMWRQVSAGQRDWYDEVRTDYTAARDCLKEIVTAA